jgi:tetratricopeptide (TPR) repeat protein
MSDAIAGVAQHLSADLRRRPVLAGLILLLIALVLYAPVSHHGFLQWDDDQYVSKNPHVSAGLNPSNVIWALTETATFYWHPLTWLSHMLDCQLFGLNAGAHHLVNALLHAANSLLLFLLLQGATGAMGRSLLVAACFAVHPLNVETVAWLAERKSVLSAFFSLITVGVYGWYLQNPGVKRYCAVMGAFLLALMSKPMAITLPLALLVLDYWPLRRISEPADVRSWYRLTFEKIPLLLMSLVVAALTITGQRMSGAIASISAVPLGMRLEQAMVSYFVYLRKIFWPDDLAAFYPYHPQWRPWPQITVAVILLVGTTALTLRLRRAPCLLAGWLLFLIMLLPVSGIVQAGRVVIADRFVYLPAIGIFLAVIWACGDLFQAQRLPKFIPATASIFLLIVLSAATRQYLRYWQDGVKLFSRAAAVERAPDAMIEHMIADALVAAGQIDEALAHYQRSCDLEPGFDLCHFNIAEILFSRYQVRGALEHYQLAGKHTASKLLALRCLIGSGEALLSLGDLEGAERELIYALRIDPASSAARQLLNLVYARRSARP